MKKLALPMAGKSALIGLSMVFFMLNALGQTGSVGIGTSTPNPNAILDITAPNNDQGLLMPRLTTTQRTALGTTINAGSTPSASNSLLVYDTNLKQYFYWDTNVWSTLTGGTNAYVYIGYAQDAAGTAYSSSPAPALDFIAFFPSTAPIAPTGATFAGLWKNYRGPQGVTGAAGAAGTNGTNGINGFSEYRKNRRHYFFHCRG